MTSALGRGVSGPGGLVILVALVVWGVGTLAVPHDATLHAPGSGTPHGTGPEGHGSMPMVAVPAAAYEPVAPTLDRADWTAMSPPGRPGRRARAAARKRAMKVLDGRARTAWRPAESRPGTGRAGTRRLRRLTIDLHGPAVVSALRYTPGRKPLGRIGRYAVHVSVDGRTWRQVTRGRWADNARAKTATFAPVPAGRVRLSVRSGAGPRRRVVGAAEIHLLGSPVEPAPPSPPPPATPPPTDPQPPPATSPPTGPPAGGEGPFGFHPGRWSNPIGLPIVPATAVLLPNNKVLTFSGLAADRFTTDTTNGGKTQVSILDLGNGVRAGRREVAETGHEMFCTGLSFLPDGRVVINGGSGGSNTTIYDPRTDTFSTGPQMEIPRGYQTSVTLSDGRVFALGGSWSGGETDKDGEVLAADGTSWHRLPGVTADSILTTDWQGRHRQDNHGWFFSTSGGRVFHAGPSTRMNWFGTSGDGTTTSAGDRADAPVMMNGNAVMYDAGKILAVGGAPNYEEFPDDTARWATPRAYTLDITAGSGRPVVRRVGDMSQPRTFANSVVLPDGSVVVTGGQHRAKPFTDTDAVRTAEVWDPATGLFTELAAQAIPRTYHSFSLLLADGRVMAGGGGLCGTCETNHPDVEILTPPYLLAADGTPRNRPAITGGVPDQVPAGATLTVTTDRPVASFALVRVGTSTHSVNSDQRRVALTAVPAGQNAYQVTIPADRGTTVPGPWLLFALDQHGTPSVGAWTRIP